MSAWCICEDILKVGVRRRFSFGFSFCEPLLLEVFAYFPIEAVAWEMRNTTLENRTHTPSTNY
eukprot:scaffold5323_cov173-Amphora_coffeaeformis.AAC.6